MAPAHADATHANPATPATTPEAVPKLPVLSASSLRMRRERCSVPCVLDRDSLHFYKFGRVALDAALRLIGLAPGQQVLLPAYHCVTMVEPVLRARADPVFYRVRADASIDLEDLRARVTPATRAAVVPHYFGFPQAMRAIRAACDDLGIVLIEDCAHALFGSDDGEPLGSFGHVAIASPWKFLPVPEGGCLVVNGGMRMPPSLRAVPAGLRGEVKAALNNLETSFRYSRLGAASWLFGPAIGAANLRNKRARTASSTPEPPPTRAIVDYDAALTGASRGSRLIMRYADRERVVQRRRANYLRLLDEWRDLRAARPLHAELSAGVVPQVFPLVVDEPEVFFPRLKGEGVPIIRFGEFLWEGMDPATCAATRDLSRSVFQLPCHQELREDEVAWIGRTVSRVLGNAKTGLRAV